MPEGVEHIQVLVDPADAERVCEPQMPEGVEHSELSPGDTGYSIVCEPQMPEGVEHYLNLRHFAKPKESVRTSDAGRR